MKPVKDAKKYAKTLISMVGLEGMPQALTELTVVDQLMEKSPEFRSLLLSPLFPAADREKALKSVAEKLKLSATVLNFLTHLASLRVIAGLAEITRAATVIYLEKKKRSRATVLSPVALSTAHLDRLKAALKKLTDRDIDIEYVMDPSLLGGVLVKVGSTMYDSSIKGQLRLLKEDLIKG
ncbi:MAG: ATP synthase F1 subunit delta [Nitrospirae bacterium]|nr:MAG: ATP synthase F1 subunit delta [Nitrospirota bacterium]